MTNNGQTINFWAPQTFQPGDWRLWEAGGLRLWVKREHHEWRVASSRAEEKEDSLMSQNEEPPLAAAWRRWAFTNEDAVVTVSPAMPEKPVVVRPDSPIRIPRGNEVLFFVSIPVVLQLHIGPEKSLFIHEEPTLVLSQTWFGQPTSGELCYALRTGASRDLSGIKKGRHRAVCPVLIRNTSEEELNLEKLCIRSMHVNIYRGATRLWTEEISVSYRGEMRFSEINFAKNPPEFERIHGLLGAAREPVPRENFLKKSFDSLWTS